MNDHIDAKTQNLFLTIGRPTIVQAVSLFYQRAFTDGIIGHFFFNKDHQHLIDMQISFTCALLGSNEPYVGKPLTMLHKPLPIRRPHFMRRRMLLAEVLAELNVDSTHIEAWLAKEDKLKPLIINSTAKNTDQKQ